VHKWQTLKHCYDYLVTTSTTTWRARYVRHTPASATKFQRHWTTCV